MSNLLPSPLEVTDAINKMLVKIFCFTLTTLLPPFPPHPTRLMLMLQLNIIVSSWSGLPIK